MEKKLSEFTLKDWVVYRWDEAGGMGDEDRVFLRGQKRTPGEAMNAAQEWEVLEAIKNEQEPED